MSIRPKHTKVLCLPYGMDPHLLDSQGSAWTATYVNEVAMWYVFAGILALRLEHVRLMKS
jgi:hypothetical protein